MTGDRNFRRIETFHRTHESSVTTTEEALKHPKLDLPLRTVLLYLLFGGLWILLSDRVLFLLVPHNVIANTFQTLKGWFFMLFSGSLLYMLLRTQHMKDRAIQQRAAWLASFPERNPNPVVELDSTGTVYYMNPAAQAKFPDLRAPGFRHPWLVGLEHVFARFQQEGIGNLQREIEIEGAWYSQSLSYVSETGRLRVYAIDITERKLAERQTAQIKRLYATLSQVNQAIVRAKNRAELYQAICDVSVQYGEFSLAWIGLLDQATGEVKPAAANGLDVNHWPPPIVNIHASSLLDGLIAQALRTSGVLTSGNKQSDERWQILHAQLHQRGFYSSAVVPFRLRGRAIGVLLLLSKEHGLFEYGEEVSLLDEMGLDISFALDTIENEKERRKIEEALRENEERLRLSLYAANQGLYDLNVQTGDAIVNREYAEMLGYDPETFVETNAAWIERLHPADRESVAKAYSDYISGVLPEYRVEFRQRTKDGDWKWILSLGKVIEWDAEAKPLRMLGTHTDITERKRTEEELRENETIFSSFLEHSPVFIFFKDKDIRALRLSRNYEQMLGMPLERALGKTMDELFPSDLAKSMVADDMHILNEGKQVDVVEELGGRIYETTKFPIMKDGKPTMLAGFTVDITERKRAEWALRASEERFRLLFENNHTIMMLIEPVSGAIRNANQAAAEFYGYPISELCTMSINEINQLTPDEVYTERMRALREERNYFNFHHRLSNGEIRSVEVHSAPVEMDGSTLLFSIVHDITERRRVEEERQARSRQLAALLEASQALTESLNLAEVSQKIVDKAADVLGMEKAALYLVEGEHLYLSAATSPLPAELPEELRRATLAQHPHLAEALSTGRTVVLPDSRAAELTAAEQVVCDALGLRTIIYAPLAAGKDTVGILALGTVGEPRQFSRDEEDMVLALANQASLALANARLYQDVALHLGELENQITERKQAQEQFHLVVESAPNAIMLVSGNGRLRLANAQV